VQPSVAGARGPDVRWYRGVWGLLNYQVDRVVLFDEPQELHDDEDLTSPATAMAFLERFGGMRLKNSDETVSGFIEDSGQHFGEIVVREMTSFVTWPGIPTPFNFAIVELRARLPRNRLPLKQPPLTSILKWKREAGAQGHRDRAARVREPGVQLEEAGRLAALALPRKRACTCLTEDKSLGPETEDKSFDAYKLLNAVAFGTRLRSQDDFGEALLDAKRYEASDSEEEVVRDSRGDPSRTTRMKAAAKADVVGMLIERRLWHEEVAKDEVRSINAFSDSSPVVGVELQGMICDVVKRSGAVRRVHLPCATLVYGQTDAMSKMMAFLWAAWLVFGPTEAHMLYFVEHLRCWTTDFGVERFSIDVPDCLSAFMAWVAGQTLDAVKGLIRYDRRLFRRALRIGGWGHSLGNIMRRVAHRYPHWPEILDQVRALSRFFRNQTWRDYLIKACGSRVPDLALHLMHYTASQAKWRFETIAKTLKQLAPLRRLCQDVLTDALFANAQEKALMRDVMLAAKDPALWLFIVLVGLWVMEPLEGIRRWALCCSHEKCQQLRADGAKHVSCPRNGRRLKEANKFILDRIGDFKRWAREVTLEACEGDVRFWKLVQDMCKHAASELRLHFKHLGVVPWSLVNADSVEGAKEAVLQINERPLDEHDCVTRDFLDKVGHDLQCRAQGGEASTALLAEISELEDTMLEEGAGEGVHRGTNLEKIRAAASTSIHIKQKIRVKGVVKTVRRFLHTHGKAGREAFRFECKCVFSGFSRPALSGDGGQCA